MKSIILGSQSPRRIEILNFFSLPFKVAISNFNEESIPFKGDPAKYVCEIAEAKAKTLISQFPETIILTADTTVYRESKIYGKPANPVEAFQALTELSGTWHSVFTGLTLMHQKNTWNLAEETRVLFNSMTPEEIRQYQEKLHLSDKAGGYAIQKAGGIAVKKIEGCYYNVMGLPINSLRQLLLKVDIDLWDYLK